MSADWKQDVLALSALYLMLERNADIPIHVVRGQLQTDTLIVMAKKGLIREHGANWAATEAGRASMKGAVAAQDVLRQFEVFSHVDLSVTLADADKLPDGSLRPEAWDPRFAEGDGTFDMRLAVISWLSTNVTKKAFSPWTMVFLQQLGSGTFSVESFWADVSLCFADVEMTVDTAYKWTDVSATRSLEESNTVMKAVYAAGQVEQQKRDGNACGGCGIPLLLFEQEHASRGEPIVKCPLCPHVFDDTGLKPEDQMWCPKCSAVIMRSDARCCGCGATIDFSLPVGTVSTETEEVTTVWSQNYGYVSYGWLDPYDPFYDVLAFNRLYYDPWYY